MGKPLDLAAIQAAFEAAFALDTCSPDDLPYWSAENPSRGHCVVASMVLNDLLGGQMVLAEVWRGDEQFGYHYWNRLAGVDIDLTGGQFLPNEEVRNPRPVDRDPTRATQYDEQYVLFKARVSRELAK